VNITVTTWKKFFDFYQNLIYIFSSLLQQDFLLRQTSWKQRTHFIECRR